MNWLTSFSFLLTLFLSLQIPADCRGFGAASKSPWANIKKANDFMNCLIQNIAKSSAFPQQEKEDMESIVATMMSAISSMSSQQRGNTQAQLQAMNMAFASSMAELVIAEGAGNEQGIALKTNALSQALKVCFKSVMGSVNRQFIAEIKDLIQMFAREAASGSEDNDVDDQSDFPSSDSAQSSYNANNMVSTNLISSDSSSSGGTYPGGPSGLGGQNFGPYGDISAYGQGPGITGAGGPGGQGPAGDTSGIANVIAQALASSQTLQAIVRSGASSGVVGQIISSALQSTLSSSLGVSGGVSGGIVSSVQSSISGMGGRIDLGSLSSSLSSVLVSGLASSGLINAGNASSIGVALVSGLIQTASRIAPQFGVRISADVSSDIRSVTNLVQTSMSSVTGSITTSSSQTSIDLGGPGGPGGYPGGPSGLGGPDTGFGPASGMPGAGGPGGQGPAGDTSGIANVVAQALASSKTLQAIIGSGASAEVVGQIISKALQSTLSSLGVSASVSGGIISSGQNSISRMGGRIDLGSLSSSLSSVLISGLATNGLINADNASSVAVGLVSGLIQSASKIAPLFGVRISADVPSDLGSIKNLVQTSISSQVTTMSSSLQISSELGGPNGPSSLGPSGSASLGAQNLGSLLSSPNGLTSPRATSRIQSLASNLADSIRNNGVDVNGIAQSLASLSSDAQNSGLSPAEAKIEALLETVVALLNILSSARIGSVNASAASSVSSSVAASFASVLA